MSIFSGNRDSDWDPGAPGDDLRAIEKALREGWPRFEAVEVRTHYGKSVCKMLGERLQRSIDAEQT